MQDRGHKREGDIDMSTTFPDNSLSFKFLPFRLFKVKLGAGPEIDAAQLVVLASRQTSVNKKILVGFSKADFMILFLY
jgi:hypothetical protein